MCFAVTDLLKFHDEGRIRLQAKLTSKYEVKHIIGWPRHPKGFGHDICPMVMTWPPDLAMPSATMLASLMSTTARQHSHGIHIAWQCVFWSCLAEASPATISQKTENANMRKPVVVLY